MKTAIFQYYISSGPLPKWVEISSTKFKKYAEAHNADYIFSDTSMFSKGNVHFEQLRVVYDDIFEQYDRVLYADVDIIPENFSENIFEEDIIDIGMVPEYQTTGMNTAPWYMLPGIEVKYKHLAKKFNIPVLKPKTVQAPYLMFNSGILLWTKSGIIKARKSFLDWNKWANAGNHLMNLDQGYSTSQVTKHLDYTELNLKWNCFPRYKFNKGQEPEEINFVHYTGGKKKFIEELYDEE